MVHTGSDENELAEALERSLRADYVRSHIKKPLEETMATLLTEHKMFPAESIDIVLLMVFTYIDLLGCLYKGSSSSSNAVEFIREYLSRIDARYKAVGGLLYDALRHGLVHLATPKRIQLQNGMILDFSFILVGQRQDSFKVSKTQEIQQRTGERLDIYRLSLNLSLLYEDLLSAMDLYAEDIRHNQALSDVFWKTFHTRRKPEKAKEEDLLNKSYIRQSDFDFVREQLLKL